MWTQQVQDTKEKLEEALERRKAKLKALRKYIVRRATVCFDE